MKSIPSKGSPSRPKSRDAGGISSAICPGTIKPARAFTGGVNGPGKGPRSGDQSTTQGTKWGARSGTRRSAVAKVHIARQKNPSKMNPDRV